MSPLLEAQGLVCHYGSTKAVKGVDLKVEKGQCLGLLGPNGAGKTTTMEALEGVRAPTAGKILFEGREIDSDYHQQLGILFQSTALPDYLRVKDCLRLFASFYKQSVSIDELIELCQLQEVAERYHVHLSGGQRQRLLLALSLVNDPCLIFLDEPTTGLDPACRLAFWQLLERLKQRGKTMLLTSHYMEEAERLCDQVAIMNKGKLVAVESPKAMLQQQFSKQLVCLDGVSAIDETVLADFSYVQDGERYQIETDDSCKLLSALSTSQFSNLQVRSPNLDDLFLKLTGSSLIS
ncbi:ABC transporter ATP-binding protein [Shewanella sp. TC10]|uniref:ABC transporter ATP-binding protein n=1 Tax=Shewanella sp. TC10 TaxID=1419739 RepID=UPI00129D385C|nr:ABC transporter ATP-binding protein [Shewanella sp. TC10]